MRVWPKRRVLIVVVTLGVLVASGCSSHSVRTGANSEGDGMASNEDGHAVDTYGGWSSTNQPPDGQGRNGGLVNGAKPNYRSNDTNAQANDSKAHGIAKGSDPISHPDGFREADGTFVPGGSNYNHQYAGIDGSGPDHGAVSGFGKGVGSRQNPDPEAWENASLGKGSHKREPYDNQSKAESSHAGSSPEGVSPSTWAEAYMKEHGGLRPEYVNPDSSMASDHSPQGGGSVAIGRTDANGSIFESYIGEPGRTQHGQVQDIYFAFDSWNISGESAKYLEKGAQWLQANPGKALTIEGHCDQRGTQDYNLVLGQKRAEAARAYLVNLGVQPDRLKIISYGKERPFCQSDSETCFQENRRNHMVVRVN